MSEIDFDTPLADDEWFHIDGKGEGFVLIREADLAREDADDGYRVRRVTMRDSSPPVRDGAPSEDVDFDDLRAAVMAIRRNAFEAGALFVQAWPGEASSASVRREATARYPFAALRSRAPVDGGAP